MAQGVAHEIFCGNRLNDFIKARNSLISWATICFGTKTLQHGI
jgi:hypothetical protein